MNTKKPLRVTENNWAQKGVNTRSTLWAGARGGAPMTSACLALLHLTKCPLWPWKSTGPGLLAEAFPAAQLNQWELPYQSYGGCGQIDCDNRGKIVAGLKCRIEIGAWEDTLLSCADSIDAVVCALSAAAITLGTVANVAETERTDEGWIAVSS